MENISNLNDTVVEAIYYLEPLELCEKGAIREKYRKAVWRHVDYMISENKSKYLEAFDQVEPDKAEINQLVPRFLLFGSLDMNDSILSDDAKSGIEFDYIVLSLEMKTRHARILRELESSGDRGFVGVNFRALMKDVDEEREWPKNGI